MENDNGVDTSQNVSVSSPETTETSAADPTKNLKSEMNRKFSKINEQLSKLVQYVEQTQRPVSSVDETDEKAPEYKKYIDARLRDAEKAEVQKAQQSAWTQALEMFPELNQDGETFDEKFFKAADKYYASFNLDKDSEAPLKAVKLAALELGKIDQLAKEKILKDESRRSRIIAEGSSTPKEQKREKEVKLNEKGLARLGINPDKLKARLKANKDKYGA